MPTTNQATFLQANNPVKYAAMLRSLESIDPKELAKCSIVFKESIEQTKQSTSTYGTITECIAFIKSLFENTAMQYGHVIITRYHAKTLLGAA